VKKCKHFNWYVCGWKQRDQWRGGMKYRLKWNLLLPPFQKNLIQFSAANPSEDTMTCITGISMLPILLEKKIVENILWWFLSGLAWAW